MKHINFYLWCIKHFSVMLIISLCAFSFVACEDGADSIQNSQDTEEPKNEESGGLSASTIEGFWGYGDTWKVETWEFSGGAFEYYYYDCYDGFENINEYTRYGTYTVSNNTLHVTFNHDGSKKSYSLRLDTESNDNYDSLYIDGIQFIRGK